MKFTDLKYQIHLCADFRPWPTFIEHIRAVIPLHKPLHGASPQKGHPIFNGSLPASSTLIYIIFRVDHEPVIEYGEALSSYLRGQDQSYLSVTAALSMPCSALPQQAGVWLPLTSALQLHIAAQAGNTLIMSGPLPFGTAKCFHSCPFCLCFLSKQKTDTN